MHIKFYSEVLKRKDYFGDLGVYGRIILKLILQKHNSWGSSVSIVSDTRLDDQGSIPVGGKGFFSSSRCVQTSFETQPSLLSNGYRGSFPGGEAQPGRDADHELYLLSPLTYAWRSRTALLYILLT
jgi:hypothetical protein